MEKKRNLWVIPTDKPSRLYLTTHEYIFEKGYALSTDECQNKNIYITNDEDIKENDYIITKDGRLVQVSYLLSKDLEGASKVVLTTDGDLIKDGIQAIDDEFLEWLVKNPSCERVEVEIVEFGYDEKPICEYKIIIPQEEHKQGTMSEAIKQVINNQLKQETLEEAFECFKKEYPILKNYNLHHLLQVARFGAKWQQEQINCELSELLEQRNEMLAILEDLYEDVECWSDISSYGYGNKIEQLIKKVKDNE
jgi:hypothetical protein